MEHDVYGLCECGYFERVPFGDRRHIHASVCPGCGRGVGGWDLVVGYRKGLFANKLEVVRDY